MEQNKIYKLHMGPAKCALDLCDGSERGEYVNQDYILNKLGRPHRAICLMYCYYPQDPKWPLRASVAYPNDGSGAWGYPYDDYFPYKGGLNGNLNDEPFNQMRDIRKHGQDVILTLTIDPRIPEEYIAAIARDLRSFGRVMLRINHEATGSWFNFNKMASYEDVAAFFVMCCDVIHREAPNVKVILCLDGFKDVNEETMDKEDIFTEAIKAADIESVDRYLALHWGWPFDVAEEGGNTFARYSGKNIYQCTKKSYKRYCEINGEKRPMVLSELNADGDVTGAYDQAQMMQDFCDSLKADDENWLSGFTMYQMRDRGRLGLEIEDPNNSSVGIDQPVLDTYKEILYDEYFYPTLETSDEAVLPAKLRWGGAEDSDGLALSMHFDANPVFCEAYFEGELEEANLMMEINGRWFYKAPGVKCIDFMSAFYKKQLTGPADMTLKIFAPPATGENDSSQGEDWQTNYYTTITALPKVRVAYKPVVESLD
ncbi:MAG: hypothetical protein MJ107_05035 [Lachnospiraceae bacterium]|nr:hypothetical protein [Lachnospiraceae bacterium]